MSIHEKTLIDPERLLTHDSLVVDGVDVSGHWNTMIKPRTLRDYDEHFEKTIMKYGGGENVYRCWQCGSCTNSCTMYGQNTDFNPRYWIYLTRLGLKDEIAKDKDIIWQCVSCNRCTNICPKDVRPEGVMKALAHWMEEQGITDKTPSTHFDETFLEQIYHTGRIEDGEVMKDFFKKTNQDFMDLALNGWLNVFMKRLIKYLPITHLMRMGLNGIFTPKTKSWGRTGEVLQQYVKEQKEAMHG